MAPSSSLLPALWVHIVSVEVPPLPSLDEVDPPFEQATRDKGKAAATTAVTRSFMVRLSTVPPLDLCQGRWPCMVRWLLKRSSRRDCNTVDRGVQGVAITFLQQAACTLSKHVVRVETRWEGRTG